MIGRLLICALGIAVSWSILAAPCQTASEPPVRLKKKERPKTAPPMPERERERRDEPREKAEGNSASPARLDAAAILARLSKNMGASEKRLAEKDFRESTREIQTAIIKDLDLLIEQRKRAQHSGQMQSTVSPSAAQLEQARRLDSSPRIHQGGGLQLAPAQGGKPPSKAGDRASNMADLY